MSNSKKSRKVGKIGALKANTPKAPKKVSSEKKTKGNKSGTRQQTGTPEKNVRTKTVVDPKHGSKKPINLAKYQSGNKEKLKVDVKANTRTNYKTPQDELNAIEADQKLETLLLKQETSTLSAAEEAYVDEKTNRYRELCELMGIDTSVEEESDEADDPFSSLEAIKLSDFKD